MLGQGSFPGVATAGLSDCLFLDVLDLDPRPTLVVDLKVTQDSQEAALVHHFCNAALNSRPDLVKAFQSEAKHAGLHSFFDAQTTAIPGYTHHSEQFTASRPFHGLRWISFTLRSRWGVISATGEYFGPEHVGDTLSPAGVDEVARILKKGSKEHSLNKRTSKTEKITDDVTPSSDMFDSPEGQYKAASQHTLNTERVSVALSSKSDGKYRIVGTSPFIDFVRNFDWASTPLGPISVWPDRLVQLCNLVLSDPNPASLHWTADLIIIYNEACLPTAADRHPSLMGAASRDTYAEVWKTHFEPIFTEVMTSGRSLVQRDKTLIIKRNDIFEETFFTTTFLPVSGPDGKPEGLLELFSDVTKHNISQRRTRTLLKISTLLGPATNLNYLWGSVIQGVEDNPRDVPQLLIYTVLNVDNQNGTSTAQGNLKHLRCVLKNSIGCNRNGLHATNLETLDVLNDKTDLAFYFRQALSDDKLVHLRKIDHTLPVELWDSLEPRESEGLSREAVILPVRDSSGTAVAFLLVGLSPRLIFDHAYEDFISLLQRQISSRVSSTMLLELEVYRSQSVADQAAAQLRIHIEETALHELRFTRFAQHAPVGICIYGPDGSMNYANDLWYEMTQFSKDADSTGTTWWTNLIFPEDIPHATEKFAYLFQEKGPVRFEIRLKGASKDRNGTWVLCSAYPEISKDGEIDSVVACFTDISDQKRAEEVQNQRLNDAIESKRQQENFIDITSHEIRNPLSVVLQCGEEIIAASKEMLDRYATGYTVIDTAVVKNILDAAETIEYCTLHQKRIIDDILTLSKMDSGLLPITPDMTQPLVLTEGVLKAFKRELRMADIEMQFFIDKSFQPYKEEFYELDPSRFSQMIINLMGNAIKFTKTQQRRKITVCIGLSTDVNQTLAYPITYLPRQDSEKHWTLGPTWRNRDPVCLHISVQDSGRGMTVEEQKSLFMRFSQASPRTHIQYGGSGLGLYICRALAEMHGGQIGFSSKSNEGSTFAFYLKMWPTAPPAPSTAPEAPAQVPLQSNSAGTSATPSDPKLNIMIVEDNLINQRVLRRQLERLGHSITVAHHGAEAIALLQKTSFWQASVEQNHLSLILMDIEMPVMDGLTCVRTIREYQAAGLVRGHVPVIAVTGNARKEKTDLAKLAGVDEVMLKPFTVPNLMPIIKRLCARWNV